MTRTEITYPPFAMEITLHASAGDDGEIVLDIYKGSFRGTRVSKMLPRITLDRSSYPALCTCIRQRLTGDDVYVPVATLTVVDNPGRQIRPETWLRNTDDGELIREVERFIRDENVGRFMIDGFFWNLISDVGGIFRALQVLGEYKSKKDPLGAIAGLKQQLGLVNGLITEALQA